MGSGSRFVRMVAACVLAFAGSVACNISAEPGAAEPRAQLPGQIGGVFTTANPTFGVALRDFLGRRPAPVQPIEFPHDVHVAQPIACTEYCHETVTRGPRAGLPSVNTCMICHETIATDRPRIKLITKMQAEGRDLAWQRVFDYPEESHVKFNHAPHVRAEVSCETCHGNIGQQTVARRNVELTMGTCMQCHKERQAPTDCMVCHY